MDSSIATSSATNRKVATVGFMLGGVLLGVGLKVLLDASAAVATGALGRALATDFVSHVVPVLFGFAFFVFLQANAGVRAWGDEVVSELRKVVWPSREDTTRMTIVVCIMLLISGAALGLLDVFSGKLIEWFVSTDWGGLFR
ncbi:MAG: preprotein translocase subunit SecE [Bdellovibrionales bacterium]|jgi:preprotein translocase subunit SecE|nr:preprotein translocase subunit SecE [Bdellovibrionales bacterium]